MNSCSQKHHYLDRRLHGEDARLFEAHLVDCRDCARDVDAWRNLRPVVIGEYEVPSLDHPGANDVNTLMDRADSAQSRLKKRQSRWLVPAAAAVLILGAASSFLYLGADGDPGHKASPSWAEVPPVLEITRIVSSGRGITKIEHPVDMPLESPRGSKTLASVNNDRVAILGASRIRFISMDKDDTRVSLDRGKIVCAVSHRKAGQRFTVESGSYAVRVIGTHFSVERRADDGLAVSVSEGTVAVSGPEGSRWQVEEGSHLSLSRDDKESRVTHVGDRARLARTLENALSEKISGNPEEHLDDPVSDPPARETHSASIRDETATVRSKHERSSSQDSTEREEAKGSKPDQMGRWRTWIIEGRYQEASQEIVRHLADHESDRAGWSLLADCHRKAGEWALAVEAYTRVIALASDGKARRARFLAGVILQDQLNEHDEAAEMFERYLDARQGKSQIRATVMVRLSKSYVVLGRTEKARRLLDEVLVVAPGTRAADSAKVLLENIGGSKKDL